MEYDAYQERINEILRQNVDIWNEKENLIRMNHKLKSENLDLQSELHEANKSRAIANEANEIYIDIIRRQENANKRIIEALSAVVNKLMRQTIAQKSHRERNIELRELCRDILQILEIAHDEYPYEDIPF